ncbi:hypothetical protein BJ085DRAFT_33531, partial [Dimargaris cristalligena]
MPNPITLVAASMPLAAPIVSAMSTQGYRHRYTDTANMGDDIADRPPTTTADIRAMAEESARTTNGPAVAMEQDNRGTTAGQRVAQSMHSTYDTAHSAMDNAVDAIGGGYERRASGGDGVVVDHKIRTEQVVGHRKPSTASTSSNNNDNNNNTSSLLSFLPFTKSAEVVDDAKDKASSGINQSLNTVYDKAQGAAETVEDATSKVGETVSRSVRAALDTAKEGGEVAGEVAGDVKNKTSHWLGQAVDGAAETVGQAEHKVAEEAEGAKNWVT